MGAAMWAAAGVLSFALARIVPLRRTGRWGLELSLAIVAAGLLGATATALDFGGWNELDWRAGLFALLGSFAAIGLVRSFSRS